MNRPPNVSVIMAAYNAAPYIRDAIDSILKQTYSDFELIIINDGSTDDTQSIIASYSDSRLVSVTQSNSGQTAARNKGFELAKGTYVAVLDADDISKPCRLEQEVAYLETHPAVGAVGSNYTGFDESGEVFTTNIFTHPDDLKVCMITCNQFGHSSVMFRRSILDQVGMYSTETGGIVEDYDLLVRISHVSALANISEPLVLWRKTPNSITHQKLDAQLIDTFKIRDREFRYFLSHRSEYRLLLPHPGGKRYFHRKSTLMRNLAYLYRKNGLTGQAVLIMLAAIAYNPLRPRNYKRLLVLFSQRRFENWGYEFL